jgi:hypothetical protein
MKNLFNDLNENEKNQILEMHKTATKKQYLSEQKHPVESNLYKSFWSEINGDNVEIKSESPTQLVINGITGVWTISYKKF